MDNTEQWKLNGDCRLCRRKKYCTKMCKRCKAETRLEMQHIIANALDKATDGAYSKIMLESMSQNGGHYV